MHGVMQQLSEFNTFRGTAGAVAMVYLLNDGGLDAGDQLCVAVEAEVEAFRL